MGELFDRYVVVDWSAAGTPVTGADSIWIGVTVDGASVELDNPSTRRAALDALASLVVGSPARTLLAVDAPLGYPAGTASHLGVGSAGTASWEAFWVLLSELIVDDASNRNNRFEVAARLNRRGDPPGPFWGLPATIRGAAVDGLQPTKPARFAVPELRAAERHLRARGRRPSSCFQLLGAGSVGGQTLTLLPILQRLRSLVHVEVWPMSTSFVVPAVDPGTVVVAETWPTVFDVDVPAGTVRDAAQVAAVARAVAAADGAGTLVDWFVPAAAATVGGDVAAVVDEGWVLEPPAAGWS